MARAHTYDLGRNESLRVGLFLGAIVSVVSLVCMGIHSGAGGPLFHLTLLAHPVLLGLVFGSMGTIQRDLERLHAREMTALSGLAMSDPLTGLYNRRYVEEGLKNLLHRADRSGGPVSVVFFDLDHFKEVNQVQGHPGGDRVLKEVARALQSAIRQGEILGRYGGDEFLLVVAADLPYATKLAERAVAAVKLRTGQSVSAGVARSTEDGTTPEELIAAADARLARVQAEHHAGQLHSSAPSKA